jgi:flagellar hook-associated protein 1 FlgK
MGLFTDGSASVPATVPSAQAGLAAKIRINAAVDPRNAGSSLDTLRDGGMNGADYRVSAGAAAYADRLRTLVSSLGAERTFDSAAGLRTSDSLLSFATGSAGWLEGQRKSAASLADYESTLLARTSDALSNAVGVNTDDETARALELERSYTASAKLLTLVNDLLKTLMDAVR